MTQNPPELRRFLDAMRDAILAGSSPSDPAGRAAASIFAALEGPLPIAEIEPSRPPARRHFDEAMAAARRGPPLAASAAQALRAIEPMLAWWTRPDAETHGPQFAEGHVNATIVGPAGLAPRVDVHVGVSLLAPNLRYPDHQHPPEEIYLALSPGEWRNAESPWREPGLGGVVYNPPNIVHSMRSTDVPLLAVWCLQ